MHVHEIASKKVTPEKLKSCLYCINIQKKFPQSFDYLNQAFD